MLEKLQSTLDQNYWAVLASKGRNDYDRRSAPSNPTISQLQEHLRIGRLDPLWIEAMNIQEVLIFTSSSRNVNKILFVIVFIIVSTMQITSSISMIGFSFISEYQIFWYSLSVV